MMARLAANASLMFAHELRSFTAYVPDVAALSGVLSAAPDRLVLAAGAESRGHLPSRPAGVLADQLGVKLSEFPGGHSGFTDAPDAFVARLLDELGRD